MQSNQGILQEDEIDLKELFGTIWRYKVFIVSFACIITVASFLYVNFKSYTPVYKGSVTLEIGSVLNKEGNLINLDDSFNLKSILENKFNVTVDLPKRVNPEFSMLNLIVEDTDKTKIKKELENTIAFILNRHKEKIAFYDKYIDTKIISDIKVGNHPINAPKKKLIVTVSFVTSLILAIFLVFFIEFIKTFKEEKNSETKK